MLPAIEKKFIYIPGFQLAYLEKNPKGFHTIFFIHGNSGSCKTWLKQFEDNYFDEYRLIALDLPGHGASSDSNNPSEDYSPLRTGKILSEAVTLLTIDKPYSFVGFSYGTNLIVEMLNYNLKPKGIAIISSCIAGTGATVDKILIKPEESIYFHDSITREDAESFLKNRIRSDDQSLLNFYLDDYCNSRKPFRSSLIQAAFDGKYSDEIMLLKAFKNPVLVVFGVEDNLVNIDYLDNLDINYWRNTIYKMADSGHFVHSDLPEKFNQLLIEYFTEIAK